MLFGTFYVVRDNILPIILVAALSAGALVASILALGGAFVVAAVATRNVVAIIVAAAIAIVLFLAVGAVIQTISTAIYINIARDADRVLPFSLDAAFRRALIPFGRLLLANVLLVLIGIGILAAMAGSFVLLLLVNVILLFLTIPLVLLFIPLAFLLRIMFVLIPQAVVIDGARPIEALGESLRLIFSRFWLNVGYLVVMYLIIGLASGAINVGFQPVSGSLYQASQGFEIGLGLVYGLIGSLIAALVTPVRLTFTTLLFFDLKTRQTSYEP